MTIPNNPQKSFDNTKLPNTCNYWLTRSKRTCRNKVYNSSIKCKLHVDKNVYDIPETCIVCCEKFTIDDSPFECGHWVHIDCIYKSCKQECPICRTPIKLTTHQQSRFNKHVNKRYQQENEDTIHIEYEFNMSDMNIVPFINMFENNSRIIYDGHDELQFENIIDNIYINIDNTTFNLRNLFNEYNSNVDNVVV